MDRIRCHRGVAVGEWVATGRQARSWNEGSKGCEGRTRQGSGNVSSGLDTDSPRTHYVRRSHCIFKVPKSYKRMREGEEGVGQTCFISFIQGPRMLSGPDLLCKCQSRRT